jgi:hypothetical protein
LSLPGHITLNHHGLHCRRCDGKLELRLPLEAGALVEAIAAKVRPFIEEHQGCPLTFRVEVAS